MGRSIIKKGAAALMALTLLLALCVPASADDCFGTESSSQFYVDGSMVTPIQTEDVDGTLYGSVKAFAVIMGADTVRCAGQTVTVEFEQREIVFTEGSRLVYSDGTSIYMGTGACITVDNIMMAPLELLSRVFDSQYAVNEETGAAEITAHAGITDDLTVDEIDLLARLVWAEAGNQCMEGKIGVANVVLNRQKMPSFPSRITDIIYDRSSGIQFSPVYYGGLTHPATEECVQAVYAALEGENTVGAALFFASITDTWMSENRPLLIKLQDHYFYG